MVPHSTAATQILKYEQVITQQLFVQANCMEAFKMCKQSPFCWPDSTHVGWSRWTSMQPASLWSLRPSAPFKILDYMNDSVASKDVVHVRCFTVRFRGGQDILHMVVRSSQQESSPDSFIQKVRASTRLWSITLRAECFSLRFRLAISSFDGSCEITFVSVH